MKFVTRVFFSLSFVCLFVLHVSAVLSMGILSKIYIEQTWFGFWRDYSTQKDGDGVDCGDDDNDDDDVFS